MTVVDARVLTLALWMLACRTERQTEAPAAPAAPQLEAPIAEAALERDTPAVHGDPASRAVAAPTAGPTFVHGAAPVAPFVAEQLLDGRPGRTLVYVGAGWCEPCQRFHRAVEAGELDAVFPGVRFIEYDHDADASALAADGYRSRLIPLFVAPEADGRAGARVVQGSVKGEGAVHNLVPRLRALLSP